MAIRTGPCIPRSKLLPVSRISKDCGKTITKWSHANTLYQYVTKHQWTDSYHVVVTDTLSVAILGYI